MGCTSSLQELRTLSPVASDFYGSLSAEYLAYSESEAEQGNDSSSEHFASKGIEAIKSKKVEPDSINTGSIGYDRLSNARLALVEVLNNDVKRVAPQKAARAQMLFDCWNEQENNKISTIKASCSEEFVQVYDELQMVAANIAYGAISKNTIEFYENGTELDADAKYIIARLIAHLSKYKNYALELDTHINLKSKKDNNVTIAKKRLVNIKNALVKSGIPKEKIFYSKPKTQSVSGKAVYLSSDRIIQNNNIDIIITSSHHPKAVTK